MNSSITFPLQSYRSANYAYANPINLSSQSFLSSFLDTPSFMPQNLLPFQNLNGSSLLTVNPLLYQTQQQQLSLALVQQQQLGAILQTHHLQNKLQSLQLINQIQNNALFESNKKNIQGSSTSSTPLTMLPQDKTCSLSTQENSSEHPKIWSEEEQSESSEKISPSVLRKKIEEMLTFFLTEFGKAESHVFFLQRETYAHNQTLLQIFDALSSKYASSGKCREDMTRFVLRKAISYLRNRQRNQQGLSCKAASLALCKKYFAVKSDEFTNKINIESEEELINFLLPYKKGSRNRTANSCFISEIFASAAFYIDYNEFLDKFDQILEAENEKKFKKLVDFLFECTRENKLHALKEFKRLPWLNTWLRATKVIGEELRSASAWKEANQTCEVEMLSKKIKKEKGI